jgi:MFS superfamily sulfate permease-like transporter
MMRGQRKFETRDTVRFTWTEFSGSLGDLDLFLPLVIALSVGLGLDMGMILICSGLANMVAGLLFRQPIAVQPMKSIAAVAITGGLLRGELVAAGLMMGVLMLGLSLSGATERICGVIPHAVVRGIQLGVGLKLALEGINRLGQLPPTGWNSLLTAVVAATLMLSLQATRRPVLLLIFLSGFLLLFFEAPNIYGSVGFGWPRFQLLWPHPADWYEGLQKGAMPQIPLTFMNSVVAVCALSADYFPGRGITPKSMAASVGLMNLVCVPLSGMPLCHGAGGLAAQFRFGARTGGSVIMLGALKIIAGFAFSGSLLVLMRAYPVAILGPMLVLAGVELARAAKDMVRTSDLVIVAITAGFVLGWNVLAGFLAGSVASGVLCVAGLAFSRTSSVALKPGLPLNSTWTRKWKERL